MTPTNEYNDPKLNKCKCGKQPTFHEVPFGPNPYRFECNQCLIFGVYKETRSLAIENWNLTNPQWNWMNFIARAIKNKPSDEEHSLALSLAQKWPTCACGELCKTIRRDCDGRPEDNILNALGVEFAKCIEDEEWQLALNIFLKIENRTHKLLEQNPTNESNEMKVNANPNSDWLLIAFIIVMAFLVMTLETHHKNIKRSAFEYSCQRFQECYTNDDFKGMEFWLAQEDLELHKLHDK